MVGLSISIPELLSHRPRVRIYPFLAAAYPAVSLLSANSGQVRLDSVLRPLVVSLALAAGFYLLLAVALRDRERTALLTTWSLMLIFAYGHAYDLIKGEAFLGLAFGRHRVVFPIWLLLLLAGGLGILRLKRPTLWATPLSLLFGLGLAIPLVQIAYFEVQSAQAGQQRQAAVASSPQLEQPIGRTSGALPDIYYIILDGYGRQDLLFQSYEYDNSEFISGLEQMGFVVAKCSRSNYNSTILSLASSLNFDYLNDLQPDSAEDSFWLSSLIRNGRVREYLEGMGYETIAFETGFPATTMDNADIYLAPTSNRRDALRRLTGFEEIFLRTTIAAFVLDALQSVSTVDAPALDGAAEYQRNHILFTLDTLENLASYRGPKFVFAHIVAPHGPFVIGPNGEAVSSPPLIDGEFTDGYRQAYADQARYVDTRLEEILGVLLSNTGTPPVIVVQADHGPRLGSVEDSFRILNAYFYPDAVAEIYPTLTPVNSFRLIFNSVFGSDLAPLVDASYYSAESDPTDMVDISYECPD